MSTLTPGTPVACSWSGGKDSCLGWHRAARAGADRRVLLTMFDQDGVRSRSHGLRPEVLGAQAAAIGLPMRIGCADWSGYERAFKEQLRSLREDGIEDVVFGDIDLEAHREWEERVCAEEGLRAHLPLWLEDRGALVDEFLDAGFRALVVAVQLEKLPAEVLGRPLDRHFVAECASLGVDACGENGEFHTLVVDGPGFRAPLRLGGGAVSEHGGYAMLDLVVRA